MVVCGELDSAFDCENENGGIIMDGIQQQQCSTACAERAYGRPGCCEWQTDWKRCIYVPGANTKIHADRNTLAIRCTRK